MDVIDCHPSHEMTTRFLEFDTIHDPVYECKICEEYACSMCSLDDDDPLREPCVGYSWLIQRQVTGLDGITRTVKHSGTGWPKPPKRTTQIT